MRHGHSGIALLEVLVAVVITGIAGTALASVFAQAVAVDAGLERLEVEARAMDRVMSAMTLLSADDLRQRSGMHKTGEFEVWVAPIGETLFRIRVHPDGGPSGRDLETLVWRNAGPGTP